MADGRTVAYAQYGAADGDPVFALHPTPGLRQMWQLADEPARALGLRLIAPERPGYGDTPFHASRTLEEYPDDIAQLADHLKIEKFALLGFSGGGFHAGLVAQALPERVTALALSAPFYPGGGLGIFQSLFVLTAGTSQTLLRGLSFALSCFGRGVPRLVERLIHIGACKADSQVLNQPEVRTTFDAALQHVFRDRRGLNREVTLFAQAQPLAPQNHAYPVHLWHGTADRIVLLRTAYLWKEAFPGMEIEEIPGAGHCWIVKNFEPALATLRRMMDA